MNMYAQIEKHEGLRLKPYKCSAGKLTIGIGRNLEDVGITEDEARYLFKNDIKRCLDEVYANIPAAKGLDLPRLGVLVNMCFNLGINRLLGFRNMLSALEDGDYRTTADEMLDSKWASQVGNRAKELSQQMVTGEWSRE